ncbi:hypothetical protein [Absidia glauca]|uniref:Uncharacterized protein n=1 Tax=Absidia glauca TaxID=4829 RepID=A0A168RC45_ABSGL|nr:hypothetical protein [Absidia glauca]
MAAYPSLNLPRFSGSTLEPTVEPVAFMPAGFTNPKRFSASSTSSTLLSSPSLSSISSLPDDDYFSPPCSPLLPPSNTNDFSLHRPNRPTYIHIPASCKSFAMPPKEDYDEEDGSWSSQPQPEFEWDEQAQTVYKRPDHHRNPHHSSRHIFWSG